MPPEPYIAIADSRHYEFFIARLGPRGGVVDETNFWSPTDAPLRRMSPGTPFFLRLPKPAYAIVGYGFFAHFMVLDAREAWTTFGWRNGDPDEQHFLSRVGDFRKEDLLDPRAPRVLVGCNILRDVHHWPRERWVPWRHAEGWRDAIVRGASEREPARVALLESLIARDDAEVPRELVVAQDFQLVPAAARDLVLVGERKGQGTFRARLLAAYAGRCVATGERTQPVLDAAHIQPYQSAASNHLQNGLLLTKDLHALLDSGYIAVDPDQRRLVVSKRLRADWANGDRFYALVGRPLANPVEARAIPSAAALRWHLENVFLGDAA